MASTAGGQRGRDVRVRRHGAGGGGGGVHLAGAAGRDHQTRVQEVKLQLAGIYKYLSCKFTGLYKCLSKKSTAHKNGFELLIYSDLT